MALKNPARTPIVFLPGMLCDERVWRTQVEALSELTETFVADLRTPNSLRGMLGAVASAPFSRFILAGFSMGGYIAQEFALSDPDRVVHLVPVGVSARGFTQADYELHLKARPLAEKGMFRSISDLRLRKYLHPDAYARPEMRDLVQVMAGEDASQVYLRQLQATLERRDLREELPSLRCPVTVIAGAEEQIVPREWLEEWKRVVPRSTLHLIPQSGHFVTIEKPDAVTELLSRILLNPDQGLI